MSDTVEKIGKLIFSPQERDAIHMAVVPVRAGEDLVPGAYVGLNSAGEAVRSEDTLGVVDPFLKLGAEKGDTFWLFLYPGSIKSLRHHWEHPSFPTEEGGITTAQRAASEQWIQQFASELRMGCQELLDAAKDYVESGETYTFGFDTPDVAYEKSEEFWMHYERIGGKPYTGEYKSFFSCAC